MNPHLLTGLLALAAPLSAQLSTPTQVIVPDATFANVPGNGGCVGTWGETSANYGWQRTQVIYDSSTLTDQGITNPVWISRLRFREGSQTTPNLSAYASLTILRMSTMATDHAAASPILDANHGDDEKVVFDGYPTYGNSIWVNYNPFVTSWSIEVVLLEPFLYDPSSGRDLVIDIDREVPNGLGFLVDCHSGSNAKGTVVRGDLTSGPEGGTGTVFSNISLISEITVEEFTPAPAPDILSYQFNEVRGDEVANIATSNTFPATGTATRLDWQTDADRARYRGNEPGYGALGFAFSGTPNGVNTNAGFDHTGSMTMMWWQRRRAGLSHTTTIAGGSPVILGRPTWVGTNNTQSNRLEFISRFGNTAPLFYSEQELNPQIGIWQHVCVVVDDDANTGHFYFDGQPAGTFSFQQYGNHRVLMSNYYVGSGTYAPSAHTWQFDLDDFRIYGQALTRAQVEHVVNYRSEHASVSATGSACGALPTGTPEIRATGGLPVSGNASFGIELDNLATGAPVAILLGFEPASMLPVDLDFLLTGPGCLLQLPPVSWSLGVASGGTFSSAVPIPRGFAGTHIYAQGLQNAGGAGGLTKLLDVNIQNR